MKVTSIIKWVLAVAIAVIALNISIQTPNKPISVKTPLSVSLVSKTQAYSLHDTSYVTRTLSGQDAISPKIKSIYNLCLGFVDVFVFIALILIALANILHWNIETYRIKTVLPKILIALLVAHLSMPIFALLSRVVDQLGTLNIFRPMDISSPWTFFGGGGIGWTVGYLAAYLGGAAVIGTIGVFFGCFVALVAAVPAILLLILQTLLALRGWVVIIGAAIAPLAIGCYILPQTETLFRRWLKIVLFWLFYPLIVWGLVHLVFMIPSLGSVEGAGWQSKIIGFFIPLVVKGAILVMAVRAPFMWEKDIGGVAAAVGRAAGSAGWKGVGFAMGHGPYALNKMLASGAGKKAVAAFQKLDPSGKAAERFKLFSKNYRSQVVDSTLRKEAERKGFPSVDKYLEDYKKTHAGADRRAELEGKFDDTSDATFATHRAHLDAKFKASERQGARKTQEQIREEFFQEDVAREGGLDEWKRKMKTEPGYKMDFYTRLEQRAKERYEGQVNADAANKLASEAAVATVRGEGSRGKAYKALFTFQKFNPYGAVAALRERGDVYSKNMDKAPWKTSEVTRFMAGQEAYFKHQQAIQREDLSHIYTLEALRGSTYGMGFEKLAKGYMQEKGLSSLEAAMQMLHADLQRLYQEQASASDYLNNLGGAARKGGVIPAHFAAVVEGFDRQRSLSASEARGFRTGEERRRLREEAERQNERIILGLAREPSGASGSIGAGGVGRPSSYSQPLTPAERKIVQLLNLTADRVGMLGQIRSELASHDPLQVEGLLRDIHQSDGSDGDRDRLLGRVTTEFGGNEKIGQIVRQLTDSRKQQLTLFGSEESAQLSARIAEKIAARPDVSVEMVQQTIQACNTIAQPTGASPDQLKKAVDLIGSHAGVEGKTITPEMAGRVAQGLELMVQRNPINPT